MANDSNEVQEVSRDSGNATSDSFNRSELYASASSSRVGDSPLTQAESNMHLAQVPGLHPNDGKYYDIPMKADGMPTMNGDGSTTTHYNGELEDGYVNDTAVRGQVTRDADGQFQGARMEYDPPKTFEIKGGGPGEGYVRMKNVKSVDITRNEDGGYTMKIDPPQGAIIGGQRFDALTFDRNGKFIGTNGQRGLDY